MGQGGGSGECVCAEYLSVMHSDRKRSSRTLVGFVGDFTETIAL